MRDSAKLKDCIHKIAEAGKKAEDSVKKAVIDSRQSRKDSKAQPSHYS